MVRAVAISVVALLAGSVFAAGGSATPALTHAQPVVAVVESASGGHLAVKRKAGGAQSALRAADKVYYGDIVLAGPGATATFKVRVPKGMSPDNELLFVQPVSGAHHTITMKGSGSVVEVTLGP